MVRSCYAIAGQYPPPPFENRIFPNISIKGSDEIIRVHNSLCHVLPANIRLFDNYFDVERSKCLLNDSSDDGDLSVLVIIHAEILEYRTYKTTFFERNVQMISSH